MKTVEIGRALAARGLLSLDGALDEPEQAHTGRVGRGLPLTSVHIEADSGTGLHYQQCGGGRRVIRKRKAGSY